MTHLKALGADFLALLHPGDPGFGLPVGLAHKGRHAPRDPYLVLGGFDEIWHAYGEGGREKEIYVSILS